MTQYQRKTKDLSSHSIIRKTKVEQHLYSMSYLNTEWIVTIKCIEIFLFEFIRIETFDTHSLVTIFHFPV